MNPWELIDLNDYEEHMKLGEVRQLQTLGEIMKIQLTEADVKTAAVLGVAGGNGLEHVDTHKLRCVYGIDINDTFLTVCEQRHPQLKGVLRVMKLNLCDEGCTLPDAELFIANLFIEYVGVAVFARHMGKAAPKIISCVIQCNGDAPFVSHSPYQEKLMTLSAVHSDVDADKLTAALADAGYRLRLTETYPLPNGKRLIRLDYGLMES